MAEQREFPHHMIKEIFEQPQALRDTIEPRILLDESTVRLKDVPITVEELRAARRINIVASGTSRHAGMAGAVHDPGTGGCSRRCRLCQ